MKKRKQVNFEDSFRHNVESKRRRIYAAYKRKTYFFKLAPVVLIWLTTNNFIVALVASALWILIHGVFFDRLDIYPFKPAVSVWFGVPGSGKTTMAALLSRATKKFGYRVLSN